MVNFVGQQNSTEDHSNAQFMPARGITTLGQMEASLEELRPQILSDLTRDLLEAAQERFQKKRRS